MPLTPNPGAIAPAVTRLVNTLTAEISNQDANPIERYLDILITHPVAGLGFEIKVLWALTKLGEFNHPKQRIQKWMRQNFEQMRGSLSWSVAEMMLAIAIGYSFSEFSVRQEGTEFRLDTLLAVDPRSYRFEGTGGEITGLKVRQATGTDATIPYEKGVHVVNQPYLALGRDPYGIAQVRRIVAAYEAWKILVAEMIVCGQRQATPIIVARVPTEEYIVETDEFGTPKIDPLTGQEKRIAISDRMVEQLEDLDNRSVLVTDLRNEISALQQMTGASAGTFFFEGLRYLERIMLMGEVVPETVVSTGISGTGDSGLNSGHMMLMEMSIDATLNQIKEGMLERVCRPLIEWRFGNQAAWGAFEVPEEKNEDAIALVGAIKSICDGPTLTNQDLEVINRTRELVGIPPTQTLIQQVKDAAIGATQDSGSAAAA
ncbi:MAG: hypothetical protein DCF22_00630 [Leptolyngbya sp.]|nr:MAG: hypothetical protein DCF22_00630 [Leptolyngbya sp.]